MSVHPKKHGLGSTDDHNQTTLVALNDRISDATLDDVSGKRDPNAHGTTTHQNGQSDEFSVAGLSGELADPQPPKSHASSHGTLGADPLAPADIGASPNPHTIEGANHTLTFLLASTVFGKNVGGTISALPFTNSATPSTIMYRDANGRTKVLDAVDGSEVPNLAQVQGLISGGTTWKDPVESFLVVTDADSGGAPPALLQNQAAIVNNWGAGTYENTGTAYVNGDLAVKTATGWDRVFEDFSGTNGARLIVVGPVGGGAAAGSFTGKETQIATSDGLGGFTFYVPGEGDTCLISNVDAYWSEGAVNFDGDTWHSIMGAGNHQALQGLQGGDAGASEFYHLSLTEHTILTTKLDAINSLQINLAIAGLIPTTADVLAAGWLVGERGMIIGSDGTPYLGYYDGSDGWAVGLGIMAAS